VGASAHLTLFGTKAATGAEQLMIAAGNLADFLAILVSVENVRCLSIFTLEREFVGIGD